MIITAVMLVINNYIHIYIKVLSNKKKVYYKLW